MIHPPGLKEESDEGGEVRGKIAGGSRGCTVLSRGYIGIIGYIMGLYRGYSDYIGVIGYILGL